MIIPTCKKYLKNRQFKHIVTYAELSNTLRIKQEAGYVHTEVYGRKFLKMCFINLNEAAVEKI